MATRFPLVHIPPTFEQLIGAPDANTRIFRAEGDHASMLCWFDGLWDYIGPCVSPGGAAVYTGVSRAGVYKRMKAGGLSAFCFQITSRKQSILGDKRNLKKLPLMYIPVAECKAWGAELAGRAARLSATRGTREDEDALESKVWSAELAERAVRLSAALRARTGT